jgi:hypothetical protein
LRRNAENKRPEKSSQSKNGDGCARACAAFHWRGASVHLTNLANSFLRDVIRRLSFQTNRGMERVRRATDGLDLSVTKART